MKSLTYMIFTVINLLKNCSPECTNFYFMLQETLEDFGDEIGTLILPLAMSEMIDDPSLNVTEEFATLQNNKECVLEVNCSSLCKARAQTSCPWKNIKKTLPGIDVHVTEPVWVRPTANVNHKPNSSSTTATTQTLETVTFDKNGETTTDFAVNAVDNHKPNSSSTTATTQTLETVTFGKDDEPTTDLTVNGNSSSLIAHKADKKETAKIVAMSVAGAAGGGIVTYLIAKKIQHILQYGAYRLPG